ncbi:MAG TPA: hypothetical protein VEE82_00740 [Thermodesulfovibrionales bacterium]|nr:hypothetical protein [Thermodesulfovibrionales bacterium]
MKKVVAVLLLIVLVTSGAYAETLLKKGIVFYGDQCQLCGEYGYCSRIPTHREAVNALISYYSKRGFRVIVIRQKERFLEAEIYKDNDSVDRVLLDIKTGRMRSLY